MKYLSIIFLLLFVFAIQSNAQCSVTLSTYEIIMHQGGNGTTNGQSMDVFAPAGCVWTATSNVDWVRFNYDAGGGKQTVSGTGNAKLNYFIRLNEGNPRTGTFTVNDKTVEVRQLSPCGYSLPNDSFTFAAEGGTRAYQNVRTGGSGSCAITYTTNASWIILSVASYTVAPSEGVARTGTIIYHYGNDRTLTYTVNQEAGCFYSISQLETSANSSGGSGTLDLQTGSACQWRAEANQDWITVTNGSGAGGGTVTYSVAPNTGAARTGIINIAGQIFTVNQAGGKGRKKIRFF